MSVFSGSTAGVPVRCFLLLFFALSSPCAKTHAQADADNFTGRTMRIWAPSITQKRILGTLVRADASRITLASHKTWGDTLEIDLGSVRIVEIAEGKRSNMLLGAVAGMGAGALIGASVGLLSKDEPGSSEKSGDGVALGIGVGVGFLVGTIIGITSESEVWKRIPPDRLRLGNVDAENRFYGATVRVGW